MAQKTYFVATIKFITLQRFTNRRDPDFSLSISRLIIMSSQTSLTDDQLTILRTSIGWKFHINWGRTLTNSATHIVVRTMAWAKPTSIVPCVGERHTTKMRADADHNQPTQHHFQICMSQYNRYTPFWIHCALHVSLRITKRADINSSFFCNFVLGSVANKNGLSTPLHSDGGTHSDLACVKFSRCKRQNISSRIHTGYELRAT